MIGYALQCVLLNRTLGDDLLPPLLVTFGLSVIIQNGLLDAVHRRQPPSCRPATIEVATHPACRRHLVGVLPLLQFAVAVAVIAGLQFVFYRTALGRAFRATADDPDVAQLMGLDNRHVFALAMALSLAVVAIAGVFLAVRANFDPSQGPGAADLRLRGGDHRRARQPVGHAGRRAHPRRRAGDRRADRSRLAVARRPRGLPGRAGGAARRACFPRCAHERASDTPRRACRVAQRRIERSADLCAVAGRAGGCAVLGRPRRLALLSEIFAYVALASLWNLLAGYAGLVSVGQQAYVGLGAYLLFALAILAGMSPLWAIPLAGIIARRRRDPGGGAGVPAARPLFRDRHLDRGRSVSPAWPRRSPCSAAAPAPACRPPSSIAHRAVAAAARLRRCTGSRWRWWWRSSR